MNRKDRRAQERALARENRQAEKRAEMIIARQKARTAYIAKIEQNGITVADLEKEYDKGYSAGFNAGAEPTYKSMMAAICLALKELHGFGKKHIKEVLSAVDSKIIYSLTSTDLADEVIDSIGLELVFDDPLERVREK